ncbi:YbhN family protein [Frankia sp. CiP3]|uniref:lysylphosphatidylglycerol synthase transmembrane domain-containing protein n=1 Tax=Frankia sp. CiP3 TaxID=2880971 RepID=UPI001EF6A868|nr:YbhN family protein [Frankia sp. CiP3]
MLPPVAIPHQRITHPRDASGACALDSLSSAALRPHWPRVRVGWPRQPRALIGIAIAIPMALLLVTRFRTEVTAKLSNVAAPAWPWLVVCGLASALFFLANALALRAASGLPLRLHTATGVQLAAAAANRLLPAGLGAIAVNVRYLERQRLTRSAGLGAVAAVKVVVALAHVAGIVLVTGLANGPGAGNAMSAPVEMINRHMSSRPAFGCVAGCLLACAMLGAHPRIRNRLKPPLAATGRHLLLLARSPRRTAILLASAAGIKTTQIVALASCVWAFNGSGTLLSIATIYLIGAAVAGAVPTAGNVGALEPALALGLTAVGGDAASMLAAVLVYRLISYWLPVLPGMVTLTALRRRDVL